ncbi:MAG: DNA adenine methylase [Kiritimatiellia bacterium]
MQQLLFSDEVESLKTVNVSSVPQLSLFRYPGGKTWFVPRLREWLRSQTSKPKILIEPFVGGGIISLTAVFENLVDEVLMVELDEDIAAVWQTIVDGEANWLAQRILMFEMTKENVVNALEINQKSNRERAFQTILKNRTFHGGILAAGAGFIKNGEGGKGILSRWYPRTLAKRLRQINYVKDKLSFVHGDAFEVIAQHQDNPRAVFFIDPPYTAGGKKAGSRLYKHFELDHDALFKKCAALKGDVIMTYDNAKEVMELVARYGFQAKPIAMKSTHHAAMTELVIGKNLDWMQGIDRVLEELAIYK